MFGRTENNNTRVAFTASGIVNLASMNEALIDAIGCPGRAESLLYPAIGEKPGNGTDVGHAIDFKGQPFIVKTGLNLGLLGQAVINIIEGRKEKAEQKLGTFIVGNFARIANVKDKAVLAELKDKILKAFDAYLASEHGQALQASIKNDKHKITTDDVFAIYLFMTKEQPDLINVIGLPAFADVVSGCHSQQFNNVFQALSGGDIAPHKLFMQPADKPGIFQGSRLLSNIKPFDQFLLAPFSVAVEENQTVEQWLALGTAKLKEQLATQSLAGLCSAVLLRHILGESADNGPDNMLLSEKGLINIDLTGFRYPRKDAFKEALGWADTLAQTSSEQLVGKIFHDSVFKDRFVKESSIPEPVKALVYNAIVKELKAAVEHTVVEEVSALRDWLAGMNARLVNENLDRATREVYANLNEQFKFSPALLDTLIALNQKFVTDAVEVAKQCQKSQEVEMQMECCL